MAAHDPTNITLATFFMVGGLGRALVEKGVLTEDDFYAAVRSAVATSAPNPHGPQIKAVLKDFWPDAGID